MTPEASASIPSERKKDRMKPVVGPTVLTDVVPVKGAAGEAGIFP